MINIGVAIADEFTTNPEATCTNLVCTVRILGGNRAVNLVLTPTSDSAVENSEEWTASLVDGGDDYNLADRNNNVAFDITDPPPPTPNIGISSTDRTAQEGSGQVALMITSSIDAPAGGLSVTIRISGATDGEFTTNPPSVCTNLVCIVDIPAGSDSVNLVLIPTSDSAAETSDRWTATLVDGSNYNLDASNNNVAFDITDPPTPMMPDPMTTLPVVGIDTSDSVMEGGAVVLTITSSIAAPTNGLTVTINIGVADMDEFESGNCNGLVCEIVIAATEMTALLTITAAFDTDDRIAETWTATIMDVPAIFSTDTNADDADFQIDNPDLLTTATNGIPLIQLNAAVAPTPLAANLIRNLLSEDIGGVTISASRYGDAATPDVFVQMLEFAALGIWVNGNDPEIGMTDHDFDYAFLGDNGVNPPAMSNGRGDAIYNLEGDATYLGLNFFPSGALTMHFDLGTFEGNMAAIEGSASQNLNAFGGSGPSSATDFFSFAFTNGDITDNGFEVSGFSIIGTGFFGGLGGVTTTSLTGRFYNGPGYDPSAAAPTELAGVIEITNGGGMNDLHMGFLGRIEP